MAKRDQKELSRRTFLGVSIGSAVAAGVGCSTEAGNGVPGALGGAASAAGGAAQSGGAASVVKSGGGTGPSGVGGKASATGTSTAPNVAKGGNTAQGTGTSTGPTVSTGGASSPGTTTASKALVSLVRATDVIQATIDAIEALGGFPDLTGKSVMLRPNAIDMAPPGCVNPLVIRGVIQAIKAKGKPSSIVVADDTFTEATLSRMGKNKIREAVELEGATCLGLESGKTSLVNIADAKKWPNGIPFYEEVLNAEYLINIPVCKTHTSAVFSMALKGWYGNVPRSARSHAHGNVQTICDTMPEMHLVKKEDFVVLDATKCLLTGGPTVGANDKVVESGIVVASRDAVAVDVTGVCILKHYLAQNPGTTNDRVSGVSVWEQPQIVRAMQLTALGWLSSKQLFDYVSSGIDEAESIMADRA